MSSDSPPSATRSEPYLVRLARRLQAGARGWSEERRTRHARYLARLQRPDGGFPGREGDSDLYYTSFAVRGLALLDSLAPEILGPLERYLRSFEPARLGVIDLMNWLSTAAAVQVAGGADLTAGFPAGWDERVCEQIESLRRADGGYAKAPEGASGSTYHSFLAVLTYELLGRTVPRPPRLIQYLYDRQREDGGFVEIGPMKNSGTNPTAAACAVLTILGAMDDEVRSDVAAFFRDVRTDEGAFQANRRIPFADSLSTFTAILTCQDLDLPELIRPAALGAFVTNQLEFPTGGMRAAMWDEATDAEYTFYGLGVLALLGPGDLPAERS